MTILVLVGLSSHDPKKIDGFEEVIKSLSEVIQCCLIAGQAADYMLKVVVSSLNEYQSFLLDKLTRTDGVSTVHSSFVLRSMMEKTESPLNHLK